MRSVHGLRNCVYPTQHSSCGLPLPGYAALPTWYSEHPAATGTAQEGGHVAESEQEILLLSAHLTPAMELASLIDATSQREEAEKALGVSTNLCSPLSNAWPPGQTFLL